MAKTIPHTPYPISSLILFLILVCGIGCDESPKIAPSTSNSPIAGAEKPSQVSFHTSMNFSSSGMLRAILHAGRVQTFDLQRYTWLDSSVKVDFYNRDGKHSTTL